MEFIGVDLPIEVRVPIFLAAAVLAVVVYTFAVLMTGPIVRFFWGLDAEDTFVKTAEKPLKVIWTGGNAVRAIFAIPWRLHRKTVFTEVLDFRPEGLFRHTVWDQKEVERKLQKLAVSFKGLCDRQESDNRSSRLGRVARRHLDSSVEEAKEDFWAAHNLAEHLGFDVRYSHTEYLPSETPTREGALV